MNAPNVAELEAAIESGVTILRCSTCRREEPVGDPIKRVADGWPQCCGKVMLLGVPRPERAYGAPDGP